MKKIIASALVSLMAYLLFWPVAIAPESWQAPDNPGYTGVFAENALLSQAQLLPLPAGFSGPEAVLASRDGKLWVSSQQGSLLVSDDQGQRFTEVVHTGGRPLGLAEGPGGAIYIADAYAGLLVYRAGVLETLADSYQGEPLVYVNDLAVDQHGIVYFSESSSKFGARAQGGTYAASLLDIMEHGGHGRLFAYDPHNRQLDELAQGFNFANGVAVAMSDEPGQGTVYVNETGKYRVLKFTLEHGVVVAQDTLIDALPGFPDNLSRAPDGNLWLGLVSPRSGLLDKLSGRPWLRKVVQRLPGFIRPKAQHYGHVLKISPAGEVLAQWQDPSGRIFTSTGVAETDQYYFVSRLHGDALARLPVQPVEK